MRKNQSRVVVALSLCTSAGCASSGSNSDSKPVPPPATAPVAQAPAPKIPIPPDSPFAKIKEGMGSDEVFATIGPPTSQSSYATGKGFIPFHFGGDNARMTAHYKGIGTITFSQDHAFTSRMSVISIDYDPNDPGFDRQ